MSSLTRRNLRVREPRNGAPLGPHVGPKFLLEADWIASPGNTSQHLGAEQTSRVPQRAKSRQALDDGRANSKGTAWRLIVRSPDVRGSHAHMKDTRIGVHNVIGLIAGQMHDPNARRGRRIISAMNYQERIVRDPQIVGGEPVLKGTRVTLKTVLASLAEGATTAEILADFPTLSEEDVRAAIAFAAASAQEDLPLVETPVKR